MRRDMDDAVSGWPYDPEPGEVIAREVRARDGRTVVQVRVELGVLQMEVSGRPDGTRPHGFTTYLDYLRYRAADRAANPKETGPPWVMAREHCVAADREFVQFYHRREAWLALQRYDRALQDADHTIALMDFVHRHGIDADYVDSHERFRGIVLFHRTRAAAALALEKRGPTKPSTPSAKGRNSSTRTSACGRATTTKTRSPTSRCLNNCNCLRPKCARISASPRRSASNSPRRSPKRITSAPRCSATASAAQPRPR